eukprot:m.2884 g.2884  ORF g.2884 m.2884 type:complete len:385 (-) comp4169_c0_seq1:93-1247(-)
MEARKRTTTSQENIAEMSSAPSRTATPWSTPVQIVSAGLMGVVFGFAMEKARVTEPMVIQAQMGMSKFIMMKMFLSAVVAGQVGLVALNRFAGKQFQAARSEFASCVQHRGWLDVGLGGAILGAGMTMAGACPGMVIIQVGAGAQQAGFTVAGLFIGAYLYAFSHPSVSKLFHGKNDHRHVFLDQQLGLPFPLVALSFSALLAAAITVFEHFFPWETELPRPLGSADSFFSMHAWSPVVSGALVGALQIPAVVMLGDTLGSSTCYMTLSAQTTRLGILKTSCGHLCGYTDGVSNWWQVVYIGSAALAAAVSASLGSPGNLVIPGVSPTAGVIGGILMLFGSRLAGGCTSGHGLSGMGLLATSSFVAVATMFGGGMAMKLALSYM